VCIHRDNRFFRGFLLLERSTHGGREGGDDVWRAFWHNSGRRFDRADIFFFLINRRLYEKGFSEESFGSLII